jgi:AraC family transcriptional regulator
MMIEGIEMDGSQHEVTESSHVFDGQEFGYLASSLVSLLETATRELNRDLSAAKASLATASAILISEIDRRSKAVGSTKGSTGLANWQIARVRAFIDSNLHRSIHTKDLSAIARRSPAHFSRSFKLAFGEPPHAYVMRRRLERACTLMVTSSTSLSQIAFSVGFADQPHLCRLFKKAFGQSPTSWRRERYTPCEEGSVFASGAHNCKRSSSGLSSSLQKAGAAKR